MATPRLGLPEIIENQSGKYLTHNEALALLETLVTGVKSRANGSVPASPSEGDAYIMDVDTGDWADGALNDIAVYYSGDWHFITPVQGLRLYCNDESDILIYSGSVWSGYAVAQAKKWALILG